MRLDLTPREREVAALVAEGRSAREIAAALSITPKAVMHRIEDGARRLGGERTPRERVAAWFHSLPAGPRD